MATSTIILTQTGFAPIIPLLTKWTTWEYEPPISVSRYIDGLPIVTVRTGGGRTLQGQGWALFATPIAANTAARDLGRALPVRVTAPGDPDAGYMHGLVVTLTNIRVSSDGAEAAGYYAVTFDWVETT